MIVSDEPTNLQTFAQYRLRFQVEESVLDLKSNGFNLESCRLRDKFALTQLIGVIALTMLFLVLQGLQVVTAGKRRLVDPHWNRGMSCKLGWNWIRLAITQQWHIQLVRFLSSAPARNLPLLLSDNLMTPSSVNSLSSTAFRLLSFVSQPGDKG